MNTDADHIDDLIGRYLAGEASPDEAALLEAWKSADDANRRYFEQLSLIFTKAAAVRHVAPFDTDKAWEKVRGQLEQQRKSRTLAREPSSYSLLWKVAAGIVLLITAGIFAYRFFAPEAVAPVALVSDQRIERDTLPDGNQVVLNRMTKIEYSVNRQQRARVAKLQGEAYFDIDRHEDDRFLVIAAETIIQDLGTSFNVSAYPDSATVEVVVDEGSVHFYKEGDPGIYLKAGEKGSYNKKTGIFAKAEPEPNVTSYKTHVFTFRNDSLAAVVRALNRVYDRKIRIGSNLGSCRLTVTFEDEKIEEIANVIAETLGLTVSVSADAIELQGPGCGTKNQ